MNELRAHFGFSRLPFTRHTPKEAFFRHPGLEEAVRRLRFIVELDGVAVLMAEAGCGKSLLLGELADEIRREGRPVHYFAHSTVGPFGLINVVARKAGLSPRRSRAETALAISEALCASERKHVLICDEAHLLSVEAWLAANARERVDRVFNWDRIAERTEGAYGRVLHERFGDGPIPSTREATGKVPPAGTEAGPTSGDGNPPSLVFPAPTHSSLPSAPRPRFPGLTPPIIVSSTSTSPASRSRPGRTIAERKRCSIAQAVW